MKRIVILIGTIILVVFLIIFNYFIQYQNEQFEIKKYNKPFLEFNKDSLLGTDVTSAINKAIDLNEQNNIKKNESEEYIANSDSSIKIYIKFDEEGTTYAMEKLYKKGMKEFTQYFGEVRFNCKKVNYHKNGKISEMYFQAINY